jgi:hypothetical protein
MKLIKKLLGHSWRTSALGIVAILLGLRAGYLLWNTTQTFWFNVYYVETGPISLLIVGWALLLAHDHKVSSKKSGIENDDS